MQTESKSRYVVQRMRSPFSGRVTPPVRFEFDTLAEAFACYFQHERESEIFDRQEMRAYSYSRARRNASGWETYDPADNPKWLPA